MIWLEKILRSKVIKSILKIRNIGLVKQKTIFTFASQLINQCLVLIMSYLLIPFSPPVCEDRWIFLILVQHTFCRIGNNIYLCKHKDKSISNIELYLYN
nr:MAG TPA: hypothetical protein [Caudoviricetes sp.]